MPVVSVIHHPLHIDREADFAIDPRLVKKIKRTLYFPLWMQQQVAPRLDKIVTVSEASRAEIERYFGIPEKEVAVVYNGTDAEIFRPLPGVAKEADLIFVGRTEDRKKGIGTLLEALSLLPEHVTLKIVDGRIPEHGLVPRLIRKYGLERPRADPGAASSSCRSSCASTRPARVAVVPSFFEGFGFPASEAMACGLPVVANAAGALPEVVGTRRQRGAARAAARRRSALAAAIARRARRSRPRSQRMGRAARARVRASLPLERRRRGARARARGDASVLLTVDLARLDVGPGQLLLDAGCGEGRHCFGALERGARVVGLDLDLGSLRRRPGALRFRGREKGALGGDAPGRRLPPALRRRELRPRDLRRGDGARARLPRRRARARARRRSPAAASRSRFPTATSEHLYLRLGDDYFESPGGHIRIFRRASSRAASRRRGSRPRASASRTRFHTPYWMLRSAVGLPRADAVRARARLPRCS